MKKVFIDGSAGTTGLRIHHRLAARDDIMLLTLPEAFRKEPTARKEQLNSCDIAFLCLPDAAAEEAVSWIENPGVTVLDTSTAHRTLPGWDYGFPELSSQHVTAVASSHRIAVPGCHASGFIALVYPLVQAGILSKESLLTCHSLTGYSGGGKKMISQYEDVTSDPLLKAPRQYGLTQAHKHLREMCAIPQLANAPLFCPIVADFYSGMEVTVPLFRSQLAAGATPGDIKQTYAACYREPIVTFTDAANESGFLSAAAFSGKDSMQITVLGNEERILLCARYDNLGKGASGAALQCMNLVLGLPPEYGLQL